MFLLHSTRYNHQRAFVSKTDFYFIFFFKRINSCIPVRHENQIIIVGTIPVYRSHENRYYNSIRPIFSPQSDEVLLNIPFIFHPFAVFGLYGCQCKVSQSRLRISYPIEYVFRFPYRRTGRRFYQTETKPTSRGVVRTNRYFKAVELINRYTYGTIRSGGETNHSRSYLQCPLTCKCIRYPIGMRYITVIIIGYDERFLIIKNCNSTDFSGA